MRSGLTGTLGHPGGGIEFMLHRAAEIYPSRLAIDDRLNGIRCTYAQLRSRSIRLARGLQAIGVGKGDVVATAFRNEVMAIESIFACAMIGAISAPLNPRLAPPEARQFINLQNVRAFIGRSAFANFIEGTEVKHAVFCGATEGCPADVIIHDYEAIQTGHSDSPFPPRAGLDDPYIIVMTGGTTGGPKGATWSHGGGLIDMLSIMSHWNIRPGQKALCSAPIYHGAGLGWACMPIIWQAGTVIFPGETSFDPETFLRTVRDDLVDCLFIVPALIAPLHSKWDGTPIYTVSSIAISSAPVPKGLRIKVAEMFPSAEKLVCYGMTECCSISMQQPRDFLNFGESVGEPAVVARVRIVDDEGRAVAAHTAGNVVTRTLGQSLYYNNDPRNTANTFKPCPDDPEELDWVFTGDIGQMDVDGRITLLDRAKDVIITGGENVPSTEVESVLMLHPEVLECAVIGLPDDRWGEMVCAVLVSSVGPVSRLQLSRELHDACREQLAGFKVPKRFVFVANVPRNAFGKILKRDLRLVAFDEVYDADRIRSPAARDDGGRDAVVLNAKNGGLS
jgi:fatty-acyl-CoA synthase